MAGFTDIVQKALYLGVGIAAHAGEKASTKFSELRDQAQDLVDEMVSRGEMTTEEARRWVEQMTQTGTPSPTESTAPQPSSQPRRIQILSDDGNSDSTHLP